MELTENNVEWITGQRTVTITYSDPTRIRKIKKIYAERPDDFSYFIENKDGSVCFKVPLKWLKITPPKKMNREYTEEERAAIAERLAKARNKKG